MDNTEDRNPLEPSPRQDAGQGGQSGRILVTQEPRSGALCPACRAGTLDYDGLLNLSCPQCGYTLGGCFT